MPTPQQPRQTQHERITHLETRMDTIETGVDKVHIRLDKGEQAFADLSERVSELTTSVDAIAKSLDEIKQQVAQFVNGWQGFLAFLKWFLHHALKWLIYTILGGGLAAALGAYIISHFLAK